MTAIVLARIGDDSSVTGPPQVLFERCLKMLGISHRVETVSHRENVAIVSFYQGYRLVAEVLEARRETCGAPGVEAYGSTASATLNDRAD